MSRKFVYKIIIFFIPIIILVCFECLLIAFSYGKDFSLFSKTINKGQENFLRINPEVGDKYFNNFHFTTPANDIFLEQKYSETFRIFVLGSSTTYGFPYNHNLMFSRILHQRLKQAFPNKNIEVVNTAISAINSFTLLDFTDQVIDQKPDLVLIYAGHNEFYGAFGVGSNEGLGNKHWIKNLHIQLMDLKLYQLIRNTLLSFSIEKNLKSQTSTTLMKEIVRDKDIVLYSSEYEKAMKSFSRNFNKILFKFNNAKIPVILSEVVSNNADLKPFKSIATDSLPDAGSVYKKGVDFKQEGDYTNAILTFERARDLDCVRFRASSEVNEIIHSLAKKYSLPIINMVDEFKHNSPHGLIGDNLMIDHVHPYVEGYFLMANAFFNKIIDSKHLGSVSGNNLICDSLFMSNYGFTKLDSLVAGFKIGKLKSKWPFTDKQEPLKINLNSYIDSLAYEVIINKDFWMVDARLQLANYYKRKSDFQNAFKEYNALICTNPYIAINYKDAAKCLILAHNYSKAIEFMNDLLKYRSSATNYFKLGELYILIGKYSEAIHCFSKVVDIAKVNPQLTKYASSYISFLNNNQKQYALKVAQELVKLDF